ncbi:MAG: hypothetical protein P8184_14585 [Calditrichia bacterium]
MNSSNSNKQDPNRNKKKSKSEEESTKSQNLLEPTSEKSGESRNNIENNNYETSNYQELQDKLLTTENDLKQTKGELEKLAERNTRLVSDNRNLTDENQNLVVEKTELEKTIKELTRKTSNLEEKLNSIKVDERAERKDPKTSKAKFEIHLYEREGQLNGKIAYPLVKNDMESFNGIDQGTIISFIKKHLDYIKRPEEISKDLKAKQKKTELNPAIYGLELYQAGALMPRQSITGDQAFQTQFIIDKKIDNKYTLQRAWKWDLPIIRVGGFYITR